MNPPSTMLRDQLLAAVLGSVLLLTSCGGSDAVATEETTSTTTETVLTRSTTTTAASVSEPVESTTTVSAPESTLPRATELVSETTTSAPTTTAAPDTTAAPTTTESTVTTSEIPLTGAEIFASNCARCHGATGEGGRGKNLQGIGADPREDHVDQVTNGGGGMPAWGSRLTPEQIQAVVDFVRTL